MDREISPDVRRRVLVKRVVTATVAVAAIVFSFAATLSWLRPSIRRQDIQTAAVERGPVDATLQASGTIIPAVEQVVSAPLDSRVLRIVRRAGDRVRAGDVIVELDTTSARLALERLDEQIAQKQNEQSQLRLRLDDSLALLRAQIEQKALDADIAKFKAAQNDRLHKEGLVAEQETLVASTTAKKSGIELTQLREALARAERSAQAQLAAGAMGEQSLRKERGEAKRQLDLAMMRADRDGVVTWIVPTAGAAVRNGEVMARIADLSSFRLSATIADMYVNRLAPGMRVRVRLDEATTLDGTIASVEPRVENGQAKFFAELDDRTNPKLRNDVRVDVFALVGRRGDTLRVKRGALGQTENERVFVKRGERLVSVPVRWGLAGENEIEVLSGLAAGDEVVISNMSDYSGVKELRLE
ncbi:MAG TPA: HlyD family efflux transporter periplasmic adaptor subunit [Thermoanaerobaculia bacterium]|jgi:HlyD family secretion protein